MKALSRDFFVRDPQSVARNLLGKILVRIEGESLKLGKITETEAYLGLGDKASHAHKGITKRNQVMFGKAGIAYVYFTYGMHWLLNIVTEKEGTPSAVLIRAVEPLYDSAKELSTLKRSEIIKIGSGPARLTKWMKIDGSLNKKDIVTSKNIYITERAKINKKIFLSEKIMKNKIIASPRIGINYAGKDADLPLRYFIEH